MEIDCCQIRYKRILLFFFYSFCILSCKEENNIKEYLNYIGNPDNGFFQSHSIDNLNFVAMYQPPEYCAITQNDDKVITDSLFDRIISEHSNFFQFIFTISPNVGLVDDVIKKTIKKDNIEALLYRSQSNFELLLDGYPVPCSFFLPMATGKSDNAYHFILSFERPDHIYHANINELELIFTDSAFSHKGISFVFNIDKIIQSPQLNF